MKVQKDKKENDAYLSSFGQSKKGNGINYRAPCCLLRKKNTSS